MDDPARDGIARMLCDLELNGPLRFLLHDHGSFDNGTTMGNIFDSKFHQVTAPQLAIDRQIKQRLITNAMSNL